MAIWRALEDFERGRHRKTAVCGPALPCAPVDRFRCGGLARDDSGRTAVGAQRPARREDRLDCRQRAAESRCGVSNPKAAIGLLSN